VGAATEVVFSERPQIGGAYVIEWDADDPSAPKVWAMEYSYQIEFGESNPRPLNAPPPRNAWNR
jgi:hypothetical protein